MFHKWSQAADGARASVRIALVDYQKAFDYVDHTTQFYWVCVRPILEYALTVFHYSLSKYLSDEIERVQKRALRIVYPNIPYENALIEAGMKTLYARRQTACIKLFNQILEDPHHKLNDQIQEIDPPLNY